MLFNLLIGFIIPWTIGLVLIRKNLKELLLMAPVGATLAYIANKTGTHLELWELLPIFPRNEATSAVPFILGLYPLTFTAMICLIQRSRTHPIWPILGATLFITLAEYAGVRVGKVLYGKFWGIGWTFLSYLVPFTLGYSYYILLKKSLPPGRIL